MSNALENAIYNVIAARTAIDGEEYRKVIVMDSTVGEMADRSKSIKDEDIDIYKLVVDLDKIVKILDDYVRKHSGGPF